MTDFIGFTYNGKHSIRDFEVYRTSDGSRYNDNIVPTMSDTTADVPGRDGQYYFKTVHKNKQFSIPIAFDHLTEEKYREMRKWLDGKEIHDLIFDEAPYKVYSAKVTGAPQLKTICFDEDGQRIYKGEGTIQLTCYWPYAHTPKSIKLNIGQGSMSKDVSRTGSVWYTLDVTDGLTKEYDYTLRLDVKTITRLNGQEFTSFPLNIGLSETKNTTFRHVFPIKSIEAGKTYYI